MIIATPLAACTGSRAPRVLGHRHVFCCTFRMNHTATLATAPASAELSIDPRRLWASLMELARIGATDKGGMCRPALIDLDRQGRELFVPCEDGISHNEIEDAKPEHLVAGCNVLLHAMQEQAGIAA